MKTRTLFLQFRLKSKLSSLGSDADLFARNEYQKDGGNLLHIHLTLRLDSEHLTSTQAKVIDDLILSSICDIVVGD